MRIDLDIYTDDPDMERLCRSYWELDDNKFVKTVAELAKEFGTTTAKLASLINENCTAYTDAVMCTDCESPYGLENRTSLSSLNVATHWICADCQAEKLRFQQEAKQSRINEAYETSRLNPIKLESLSLRHSIFLMSLLKFCADESLERILPFSVNPTDLFTPDQEYDYLILKELYLQRVIAVSPGTDLRAITLNDDSFSFKLDQVEWVIPMGEGLNLKAFYFLLDSRINSKEIISDSSDELIQLIKEIGQVECLAFLQEKLEEHQLRFTPGEKTNAVIARALESFSVSQIYNFMWRAAKDAAAFYVRSNTNRVHAANTVVANIEKQVDRALANNWDVAAYRRNYVKPQSMVSRTLFNSLLKTDDGGFHLKLEELMLRCLSS